VKFCACEGGVVTVTISSSFDTTNLTAVHGEARIVGSITLEVMDNGAGIAPENVGRVFGEFTQFDKSKLQGGGGSGLGLWISRRIATLHGGTLTFHSEGLGKGATFYLRLPVFHLQRQGIRMNSDISSLGVRDPISPTRILPEELVSIPLTNISQQQLQAEVDVDNADVEMGMMSVSIDRTRFSDWKILIVDDSLLSRKIIIKVIAAEPDIFRNPTLVQAEDGDIAVQLALEAMQQNEPFHLIFMDYIMINMHGPEAVSKIRQECGSSVKIVGLTGNALPEDIATLMAAGCDHVIVKPLRMKVLYDYLVSINQPFTS